MQTMNMYCFIIMQTPTTRKCDSKPTEAHEHSGGVLWTFNMSASGMRAQSMQNTEDMRTHGQSNKHTDRIMRRRSAQYLQRSC
mmetsp:Transcript_55366/g.81393  ORF Transcript_55366/g.81393 Transcript_55366/m.81393 type:complete len:83 (+) Transcript_55366:471-719(+)